jgi:hypothetical protein
MIRIEVTSDVEPRTAPKRPNNQVCWAFTLTRDGKPQPHPTRCLLPLWDGDSPMAPGVYALAPQSIYVGRYGDLSLAPKLVPIASASGGTK